jgi:hypothetical protein
VPPIISSTRRPATPCNTTLRLFPHLRIRPGQSTLVYCPHVPGYQRHSRCAHATMTAPHIVHEPIRRHSPGPSARSGRVRAKARITAKLEIRQSVDQHSPPLAPRELEIRNLVDQQSSRHVCPPLVFFASFVDTLVPALLFLVASPPEPKNTFTSALTRYPKTPYGEKTDFFHIACLTGGDAPFSQRIIPQQLTTTQKRPKPSRLTQNSPRPQSAEGRDGPDNSQAQNHACRVAGPLAVRACFPCPPPCTSRATTLLTC